MIVASGGWDQGRIVDQIVLQDVVKIGCWYLKTRPRGVIGRIRLQVFESGGIRIRPRLLLLTQTDSKIPQGHCEPQ